MVSILLTAVLGGISIRQASLAAASAKPAEERSQQGLDATRDGLARSDENTRKQIEAMEKMVRELLDDPRQPKFGGPVRDEKGHFSGGNQKNGCVGAGARIVVHADTLQPRVVTQSAAEILAQPGE